MPLQRRLQGRQRLGVPAAAHQYRPAPVLGAGVQLVAVPLGGGQVVSGQGDLDRTTQHPGPAPAVECVQGGEQVGPGRLAVPDRETQQRLTGLRFGLQLPGRA